MKQKKKKIYFEAASLLLLFIILTGTISQISRALNIVTKLPDYEDSELNKAARKNLVFGMGFMDYIFPENLDNFNGDYWYEESSTYYNKGLIGRIKNTDIIVNNCRSMMGGFWILLVFPRIFLLEGFVLKNFSGWIYCDFIYYYHGPWGASFRIFGSCEGVESDDSV